MDFGFLPYGTKYEICEVNLKCRPCTHIGRKECPKKHFNCMKLVKPEMVLAKIEKLKIIAER
jgi:heptosyltransferase-2